MFYPVNVELMEAMSTGLELSDLEVKLHENYTCLLQAGCLTGIDAHRWTLFYRDLAYQLGFVRKSRILHRDIYSLLKDKWSGTMFIDYFHPKSDNYWLTNLFRKHRKAFHPIYHLLAVTALVPELSIDVIIKKARNIQGSPIERLSNVKFSEFLLNDLIKQRMDWESLVMKNPTAGVKKLRNIKRGGSVYAWLYRNDYEWLMNHTPKKMTNSANQYKIDYAAWDKECLGTLKRYYARMIVKSKRPRLSKTMLIGQLPRSASVEKHLQELPQTLQWLERYKESNGGFRVFRLEAALKSMLKSSQKVTRWGALRSANIRKEYVTPEIENILLKYIN